MNLIQAIFGHRKRLLSGEEIWPMQIEHRLHVLEQDLKEFGCINYTYRQFLAENGLSKSSHSLADHMRHAEVGRCQVPNWLTG